jgi:aryl-alcohol dehydrogenase-like predicted oxidoreductase
MQTRRLGNSDMDITRLGFGAWAIGGSGWTFGWGTQDDDASIGAIRRALDLGVNWIDTAAIYGLGHSEEVVAKALEGQQRRPYIFTKCGLVPNPKGEPQRILKADSIRKECEASLRRLRTDVIDLYQIHWPNPEIEEAWSTMAELQREGKVRWIGVSNFDSDQLRLIERIAPVTSLQPPFSLIENRATPILEYARSRNIGVIAYSPMYSGLLTGAMTRQRALGLPDDDWRKRNPEFQPPRLERNLELVEVLRRIGARRGRSPGEVAVAWTLRHPAVTGAIVGARNPSQVDGWIHASDFELTDEDLSEIRTFLRTHPTERAIAG